ncbi:hypothetical protein V1L52_06640 [Treponema sp. HNW]|uniref:hypothetical protein n=1 Tax=Treponema sp. HNW TaxID=3116654 RepID=UPI003D115F4E
MEKDSELQLFSNVHEALSLNSGASQRDLAEYTNLSLGRYYRMSFIKIDNEDFNKDENYVTSDALVVFSDEMQYEAGKQHESDYIRSDRCTSVMDIIRHSEKSFA